MIPASLMHEDVNESYLTFSSEKAPIPFPDPLLHEVSNFVINTSVMNIFSVIVTLLEQNVHFFMFRTTFAQN